MRAARVAVPTVLALGLLLTVGVLPASALTPADIPAPASLMTGTRPYVSTDPATGTTLVVAEDSGAVIGQLFDADFAPLGASFPISESGSVESPSAEWDPENDQWLVVWHDDSYPSFVNGRILALNGTFVTSQLLIADQDLNGEAFRDSELVYASYAADQDGFLVAFKTTVEDSGCQVAMVAWVGADGTVPTTAATPVSSDDPSVSCAQIDNGADLTYSSVDSEWIVAWYDSTTSQTMARRVGTGATPSLLGAPFPVGANTWGGSSTLAYDPSRNRVLLGWHTGAADGNDAVGALVSATDVVTPAVIASGSADLDWRRPSVVYAWASDHYFAVLHDNDDDDDSDRVYLVQIDAASGVAEEPMLLEEGGMVRPSISTDGACLWIVWEDGGGDIRGLTTCDAVPEPVSESDSEAELAATGVDTAPLAAAGGLSLLLGGIVVLAARRRTV